MFQSSFPPWTGRLLKRALESVLAQRYERFEVLVVDDGGHDGSRAVVDELADSRIRWRKLAKGGEGAARNAGLDMARGEFMAYLDDDDRMDPEWLYAVVWTFEQRPEVDMLYGACITDDLLRVDGQSSGELPMTSLDAWGRDITVEPAVGALAHRNGLPDARFDESLAYDADGDLLRRLTAVRDPLVLPVIACYIYTGDAPDRVTVKERTAADDGIERGQPHASAEQV